MVYELSSQDIPDTGEGPIFRAGEFSSEEIEPQPGESHRFRLQGDNVYSEVLSWACEASHRLIVAADWDFTTHWVSEENQWFFNPYPGLPADTFPGFEFSTRLVKELNAADNTDVVLISGRNNERHFLEAMSLEPRYDIEQEMIEEAGEANPLAALCYQQAADSVPVYFLPHIGEQHALSLLCHDGLTLFEDMESKAEALQHATHQLTETKRCGHDAPWRLLVLGDQGGRDGYDESMFELAQSSGWDSKSIRVQGPIVLSKEDDGVAKYRIFHPVMVMRLLEDIKACRKQ